MIPKIPLRNLRRGKYHTRLTKRIPLKKLKDPREIYKHTKYYKLVKDIFDIIKPNNKFYLSENIVNVAKIKKRIYSSFGININKVKGETLHFFLPMVGMNCMGWFYKGLLEQMLPKARFTFLVTPSSNILDNKLHYKNKKSHKNSVEYSILDFSSKLIKNGLENLKRNMYKSLNKNDQHFVIIDFLHEGRTFALINKALSELYSKDMPLTQIHSIEARTFDLEHLDFKRKTEKGEHIFSRKSTSMWGVDYSRKEFENLEKIAKYTFYYLGLEFSKDKEAMLTLK